MKKYILIAFASVLFAYANAQEFAIKKIELTPDKVNVFYDLVDTTKNRTYTVYVYSSRDNFLAPLTKVSGAVGLEVKPGLNNKVAWSAKEELGPAFDGEIELEIRGRVYIPFIRFAGFDAVKVLKRTQPFLIKWSGGTRQNILNFQLYRNGALVYTFPNVPNTFEYKLTIPRSVKPGSGYYLVVSDTKNKDQVVVTSKFSVKPKVPLLVKALPVAAIGTVAVLLLGKKDTGDDELADPQGHPANP